MRMIKSVGIVLPVILALSFLSIPALKNTAWCGELQEIINAGKLRHLGIPYANFIVNKKTGLDNELMQQFAAHIGVQYEFVETSWHEALGDLTGKKVKPMGEDVAIVGKSPVRGDVIATGFTILPWRGKVVNFSTPTFPTGVWLISRADSSLQPISPTGDISKDIEAVKRQLKGKSVLGLKDSCLDPELYGLDQTGAIIKLFPSDRNLNEMIPAVMARMADATLMDVPVALIALENWPGAIKVVGPISPLQAMGCAFPKTSPDLLQAFNQFFQTYKSTGTYRRLVSKYYPSVFSYYPDFFKD